MASSLLLRRASVETSPRLSHTQISQSQLIDQLVATASDPIALGAMTLGSAAFRFAKWGAINTATRSKVLHLMPRPVLSAASTLFAFKVEVSAFRAGHHHLSAIAGRPSPEGVFEFKAWMATALDLGMLKGAGTLFARTNPILTNFVASNAMVAGRGLAAHFHLIAPEAGTYVDHLVHAQATLMALKAGMGLSGYATGGGVHRWEALAKVSTEALLKTPVKVSLRLQDSRPLALEMASQEPVSLESRQDISGERSFLLHVSHGDRLDPPKIQGRIQLNYPEGYFLDGKKFTRPPQVWEEDYAYYQLRERVVDPAKFEAYVEDHIGWESAILNQILDNTKSLPQLYELNGHIAARRFIARRYEASASLQKSFFDPLGKEQDPRKLTSYWSSQEIKMGEILNWLRENGLLHPDRWTRHYAIRLVYEWAKAHPRLQSLEKTSLYRELEAFTVQAMGDAIASNMILGWHLLRAFAPFAAMSEARLSEIKLAATNHPQNLEFGLARYVDPSPGEGAFLKYQRNLLGMPEDMSRIFSPLFLNLHDINPQHSLADFNPNPHRRSDVFNVKLARLASLVKERPLNPRNVVDRFLGTDTPRVQLRVFHWAGEHIWLSGGHHRMSALYAAESGGLLPRSILENMPIHAIDWSPYLPRSIYHQLLSRGAVPLRWDDLLP